MGHLNCGNFSIDDIATTLSRRDILKKKKFLRRIYVDWYEIIRSELGGTDGTILELGSGAGFLKEIIPNVITSEILRVPHVDVILDGLFLPFKNSLRALVMVDVFHHLNDASIFLKEARNALKTNGMIIMIEPWVTPWSRFIYGYLHHEPFEPDSIEWNFPKSGPLSGANGALPWIAFKRDRHIFEQNFPRLRIKKIQPFMPIRYLISGGFTTRLETPSFLYQPFKTFEGMLKPFMNWLGMFALIVLEKSE
jgi:SAM-dependent methyltransferase